jgi:hypothetical protein
VVAVGVGVGIGVGIVGVGMVIPLRNWVATAAAPLRTRTIWSASSPRIE